MLMHGLVRTCIFLLGQLRGTGCNDTPAEMSTPSTQTLVPNTISQEREQGLLREIAALRA